MKLMQLAGWAAILVLAGPLQAQQPRQSIQITPYAGYMGFGNLVSGPLGSGISNGTGMAYGAQLGIPVTANIGFYGNLAYSRPGLEAGIPVLGGVSVGEGSVLMYDGGVQLSLPGRTPQQITPFLQAGIGGMRYSFDLGPLQFSAANLAYNIGAGADLPLARNLGLRILAKDYIGKFEPGDVVGIDVNTQTTHNWALNLGLTLGF